MRSSRATVSLLLLSGMVGTSRRPNCVAFSAAPSRAVKIDFLLAAKPSGRVVFCCKIMKFEVAPSLPGVKSTSNHRILSHRVVFRCPILQMIAIATCYMSKLSNSRPCGKNEVEKVTNPHNSRRRSLSSRDLVLPLPSYPFRNPIALSPTIVSCFPMTPPLPPAT